MRKVDIFRRAGRNLRQAKGRTILTSLAIAVGAFTLTLSLAAGEGARRYADNLLKNNVDPQALYITKDDSLTSGSGGNMGLQEYSGDTREGYRPGSSVKMMTKDDTAKLQARSDLKEVVPFYNLVPTYTQFEGKDKKYVASLSYYDSTILSETATGTLPPLGRQIDDKSILIPEEYATQLGVTPNELLGKRVSITFSRSVQAPSQEQIEQAFVSGGQDAVANLVKAETKTFDYTISAVVKKPAMAMMANPQLRVSTNAAKELAEFSEGNSATAGQVMAVSALAIGDAETVKNNLKKDYGYNIQTAEDAQGMLFSFVNILQSIVVGFALLALVASVFGIINTQYISVLERTSQIGLMKALGMPRSGVAKLFRYEAAWIGLIGGALGVIVALIVGTIANPIITDKLELGDNHLLVFVWWQIAILILSLVLIAIIAGWLPARKAAKLDPIEALRTE